MTRTAYSGILLLVACVCFAQSSGQTRPAPPDGGTRERLISIFIPNLPNAPFTATVNTEWVRTLPNGARITLVNHRLIARDTAGRIFQERRTLVPQYGKQESLISQTEIGDPILKQEYICIPQAKTCQLEVRERFVTTVQTVSSVNNPDSATQSLGTQTVAGLETVGTRETFVIPANEIGNDSPINTTREFWFSPQLGLNLISVRDDPRFGTQRFEVSDITLGEPDATLFSPPAGSRIIDLRNPPVSQTSKSQQ